MAARLTVDDPFGAFCTDSDAYLEGAEAGPLAGLTFAAKDIFDIAGHVTGGGNPDWKAAQEPAAATTPHVARLVAAGATMVGKTITDEITRGILGENQHDGTPVNPRAPGRVAGGSSSGSAAAVAGGLVDFALGSDTGGSVWVPASFCGLYGMRTTHGRLSLDGMLPQAASFDTVGWFARDADLFARVATAGNVLFGTVDFGLGVALAAGLVAGVTLGAKLAHAVPPDLMKRVVAWVVVVVGLFITVRLVAGHVAAMTP